MEMEGTKTKKLLIGDLHWLITGVRLCHYSIAWIMALERCIELNGHQVGHKACGTLLTFQNSHSLLTSFSSLWCIPFCSRAVGWWPALTSVHQLCKAFLSFHSSVCFCVCFKSSVPQYHHNMLQYAVRTYFGAYDFFLLHKTKLNDESLRGSHWWATWPPPPFSFSVLNHGKCFLWCVFREAVLHSNLCSFSIVRNTEGGPGLCKPALVKTHLLEC